jgi:hypothetical protein
MEDLIRTAAEFEGRKIRTSKAPNWLCEIGAFFSTLFSSKDKEPLVTRETIDIVGSNCDYDNSRRAKSSASRQGLSSIPSATPSNGCSAA